MTTLLLVIGVAAAEWAVLLYGVRLGDRVGFRRAERLGRIELERERLACRRTLAAQRERHEREGLTVLFGPNVVSRPSKARLN